jgi:hypothetical protein
VTIVLESPSVACGVRQSCTRLDGLDRRLIAAVAGGEPRAIIRAMRRILRAGLSMALLWTAALSAQQREGALDLATVMQRAGDKVEQYFARAQSLVCLETVRLQPLGSGLTPDGFGRTVQSELRLSWDPFSPNDTPPEARTLRQVLKVNGHPPRKDDRDNCTSPEQQSSETQPLSMLLPGQRKDYVFSLASPGKIDGRPVLVVDYRLTTKTTVDVKEVEGKDDCISYDVDGGLRGKIWIDPGTFEVMRLDQGLAGLVDITLPRQVARRPGVNDRWVLERMDTSIRFKPVTFKDPDETLMLPSSSLSLRITHGAGTPRLRTSVEYAGYRRFLTGARVVQP